MRGDKTFSNYIKLSRGQNNRGRYSEENACGTHEFSTKKWFQKYGNSYVISMPHRKTTIIIGPHWLGVIVTICVIWGGTWLNLRAINKHVEYSEQTVMGFHVFITFFFTVTHLLLILTATTDPGIIFNSADSPPQNGDHFHLNDGQYCEICSIYQSDEKFVHHCTDCNYCIEGMDHHCPWMVSSLFCFTSVALPQFLSSVSSVLTTFSGSVHWQEEHEVRLMHCWHLS